VNKRASQTMRATKPLSYPDVMGVITNGLHFNLDPLQLAVATRPPAMHAGSAFDAIVLLQNTVDVDVDAVIRLLIPEIDLAGHKGRFSTKLVRPVRIGLRPGEVGCTNMPIMSTHQTAPGNTYKLQLEIQVEQKQRGGTRVRDANGGTPLKIEELSEQRQQDIKAMSGLNYSVTPLGKAAGNKVILVATFEVLPPEISALPQDLKPAYITLWTAGDFADEAALAEKVKALTSVLLPKLNHTNVFFPLLKATQAHFERAQFRLWAGEAVAIAKVMTFVLEAGIPPASDPNATPQYPRWFVRLCRLLNQNPQAAMNIDQLVGELLYPDLVYDAAMLGFAMLVSTTKESFGSNEEMVSYGNQLVASLTGRGEPLDLTHVYLPLVLAGLVINTRVTMPQEQTRETTSLIASAREKRTREEDNSNKFVFKMADDLIQRSLEHF
jgi:hypothetical protein